MSEDTKEKNGSHEVPVHDFHVGGDHLDSSGMRHEGLFDPDMYQHYKEQLDFYAEKQRVVDFIGEASDDDIKHNDWIAGVRELLATVKMMLVFFHGGRKLNDDAYQKFEGEINIMLSDISKQDFGEHNTVDSVAESIASKVGEIKATLVD